jgi:FkbM family methyltransferase
MLSAIFNRLPLVLRAPLKRSHSQAGVQGGNSVSLEREFRDLPNYLRPGECAIHVGAGTGHGALRMADIVGATGTVIAFEANLALFAQLCANVRRANVMLINACASAGGSLGRMPAAGGAGRTAIRDADLLAPCLSIDELRLPARVALLKVDAGGQGAAVLEGAERTIARDRPTLLVEAGAYQGWLTLRGYRCSRRGASQSLVAREL